MMGKFRILDVLRAAAAIAAGTKVYTIRMNKISGNRTISIAGLPSETYRGQSQELRYFANGDGFRRKPEENHSVMVLPPPGRLDTAIAVAQNLPQISCKQRRQQ
jgi:hypothetical protein